MKINNHEKKCIKVEKNKNIQKDLKKIFKMFKILKRFR